MPQAAKLGADDFKFAGLCGREMHGNFQARNEVLLDAQYRNVERMADVLGMQSEQDGVIHRDNQRTYYHVVASRHIVRRIQTEVISVAIVDLVGMEPAKLAVRTGVAEIKGKLLGLNVNMQGIRSGRRDVDRGPRLRTDEGESQNLDTDHKDRSDDHSLRPAGEYFDFSRRVFVELIVDCRAGSGYVRRHPPGMPHEKRHRN